MSLADFIIFKQNSKNKWKMHCYQIFAKFMFEKNSKNVQIFTLLIRTSRYISQFLKFLLLNFYNTKFHQFLLFNSKLSYLEFFSYIIIPKYILILLHRPLIIQVFEFSPYYHAPKNSSKIQLDIIQKSREKWNLNKFQKAPMVDWRFLSHQRKDWMI